MSFSHKIIDWYNTNKRDLPWRKTNDAYKIWLSEIIMQQTRIEQGTSYYLRFVEQYPDVFALANALEEDVLKLWQGLGYYSRARNLHATAREIANNHNGKFPASYTELLKLKGVGEYTAAAIASFAFDLPYAVADGNVERLMARYFSISIPVNTSKGKKSIREKATENMDHSLAGLYNQAIMEFGALVCKPTSPLCSSCIFKENCGSFKKQIVDEIPVKSGKTKIRNRFFNYLFITNEPKKVFIKKRIENDIWKGLYDFPMIETKGKTDKGKLKALISREKLFGKQEVQVKSVSREYIHILSHQKLHARFYVLEPAGEIGFEKGTVEEVAFGDLKKYPIPRLVEKFLIDIDFF
ncbi:MAG: A/G-specific adenine glycosylase [Chlorobi bacterium]|nr:A/G-specific adenine glycosylase [Chlorobiota bacterium]